MEREFLSVDWMSERTMDDEIGYDVKKVKVCV